MAENALASERSDRMRATLHNFMVAIGRLLSDDESSSIQYQLINLTILMRRVEVGAYVEVGGCLRLFTMHAC